MYESLRLSMAWLHTWFGLVLGYVLMSCFFFGALSVFDREIDRWAIPQSRFEPQPMPSYERLLAPAFARLRPHPDDMAATAQRVHGPLPDPETLKPAMYWAYTTHRDPVLSIGAEFGIPNRALDPDDEHVHVHGWSTIDPRTGAEIPT
ncbi:MAG: PepSY domain-containing protein, partial [Panacagrimonas sp.]